MTKILLIEDDPNYRASLIALLRDVSYEFIEATTPREGIARIENDNDIRIVVLDLSFPDDTGAAFLDYVKPRAGDFRVIVLTGHEELLVADDADTRHVFAYLPKADVGSGQAIRFALRQACVSITQLSPLDKADANSGADVTNSSGVSNDDARALPNGRAIRVFLSYERLDRVAVTRVFRKLRARGFAPWMDCHSITGGKQWEPAIRKAIDDADYFVFFLSTKSGRKEGVVRKEVNQALEKQRGLLDDTTFFIPVRIEECEVSEPFSRFHYIDLFQRDGFERLIRAISN